jgi:hypothetical protein
VLTFPSLSSYALEWILHLATMRCSVVEAVATKAKHEYYGEADANGDTDHGPVVLFEEFFGVIPSRSQRFHLDKICWLSYEGLRRW